jgi:hypothetical protein
VILFDGFSNEPNIAFEKLMFEVNVEFFRHGVRESLVGISPYE